jgi:catechol 2,3-dioxygenase-like lactoylglutathione lyase family enzyme
MITYENTMTPVLTHLALAVRDLDANIAFYARYCHMRVVHDRGQGEDRVVWIAEPGRERELIFVLMQGAARPPRAAEDYSHMGFALDSRDAVDAIADRARDEECLAWPARQEDYPVGYYCGVADPSGNVVEFSYGQPLGPGAPEAD